MPDQLDAPDDDESVYIVVGELVEDLRPVNQGDVYRGITLPGFAETDHELIVLTTHPCSLRAGPTLRPRLQAAPVRPGRHLSIDEWRTEFLRQMPFPCLVDDCSYMATLTESSIVTPAQLASAERVAALSETGILLLQQRLVWALTHAVVDVDTLAEYSAPVFAEIEILEEWNRGLCAVTEQDRSERLRAIAWDFEEHIRTSGLQADLANPTKRGDARRRLREELHRRQGQLEPD